jgi:hypothetical protein
MLLAAVPAQAQVVIGGSVYGGGNEGNVTGNATVTLRAGDIDKVFGGARMADVGGRTFVNIDGKRASDYMLINYVYGGNDISGNIGHSSYPTELEKVGAGAGLNLIDNSWNTFVRISDNDGHTQKTYIGQLFGGGNGDYDYGYENGIHTIYKKGTKGTDHPVVVATTSTRDFNYPDLGKTYLEILGGSIVYAFGGGNNATVNYNTVIHVDNPSTVVNSVKDKDDHELLTDERIAKMGYNPGYTYPTSAAFQIGSFFGGNNKATMAIRPTWNLLGGKIRNIYSGGNEGDMTSTEGLLVEIPAGSTMVVDNIYGGCRKASVIPGGDKDSPAHVYNLAGYSFPDGFSARVIVAGGDVNNVYGGNDISGKVYGGNAVGIRTSIRGDVYGGGNGSYPYTDNAALKDDPTYGDLYYGDPTNPFSTDNNGIASAEALNAFRPNAEQVSIRLHGESASNPTVIGGSVYLGGNSATLSTTKSNPTVELKIGSYVIAENVFLGNNGENMIKTKQGDPSKDELDGVLYTYKHESNFTTMDLEDPGVFAKYMDGCAMSLMPSIKFDNKDEGDLDTYKDYSTYFGSFYCGGNVGSMIIPGTTTINFTHKVIIYNKVVGGCNNAYVPEVPGFNAAYNGGLIGSDGSNGKPNERPDINGNLTYVDADGNIKDRLILNLNGLKIQPMRMPISGVDDYASVSGTPLVWNTIKNTRDADGKSIPVAFNDSYWSPATSEGTQAYNSTLNRRLDGGNIYGGCCNSGVVNGNVKININATIVEREKVFAEVETDDDTGEDKLYGNTYTIKKENSGVILGQQGMDVLGSALNVFGGGKGKDTEIWGSTTVNLNRGYTFQIFGGSEEGAIGKKNASGVYYHNEKFSTYVNLSGSDNKPGVPKSQDTSEDLAQIEFIYGGGFEGPIAGSTHVDLGNGRLFNSFAGSCNADILGHTETYVGVNGFPYVRDYIYGGNDLGGKILNTDSHSFSDRVRVETGDGAFDVSGKISNAEMLKAAAYIEYQKGHVDKIFAGCYGVYDYTDPLYGKYFYATGGNGTTDTNKGKARQGYSKPFLGNAFVNFRPVDHSSPWNTVEQVFGAGQGYLGEKEENKMQNSSYVLIDIPQGIQNFQGMEVFGGGECGGVGMGVDLSGDNPDYDKASAIIDLARGHIQAVYGGSYEEGITRRTVVNVPAGSTIQANSIFGGAYGLIEQDTEGNDVPRIDIACDVIEANVNWSSADAIIEKGIYGGNNACRRTLYGKVNINSVVQNPNHWTKRGIVYGAGYGVNSWSQYTEVNLNEHAEVQEVYGGGENGQVINKESVAKWKTTQSNLYIDLDGYNDAGLADNTPATSNQLFTLDATRPKYYNTNVHINQGATVVRYCYGGGLGNGNIKHSGNVYGTTYIDLLGGIVKCDLYAAGTTGSVKDSLGVGSFIASSTAYIEGGTARNVYGGGWEGSVGHHQGIIRELKGEMKYVPVEGSTAGNASLDGTAVPDILGATYVIIGKPDGTSFTDGIPAIERNAYGGGEGGAVFGTTHLTLNKGYIGYRHFSSEPEDKSFSFIHDSDGGGYYQEKIDDETRTDGRLGTLYDSGCVFGGGYVDNSSVDGTEVTMLGGRVRNSLFGGGEIAAIGRARIDVSGESNSDRELKEIFKAGKTHVQMFDGYVQRNVFGGGRGYDNLGGVGMLYSDGFVFGQTEVDIYGGEVGTTEELAKGNGNVFGGGDIGYVYSAYENESGDLCVGKKSGTRYVTDDEGYYYKYENDKFLTDQGEKVPTEDCKVLVEPHCKVTSAVTINGHDYAVGEFVPTSVLHYLHDKNDATDKAKWACLDDKGIIIRNAIFAGGNTAAGSAAVYANATSVFGNATASVHDVYHRDLITVGTGRLGGIYGDGNLTLVDGYRGLNITNYGTDYYHIRSEITKQEYDTELTEREQAYYELRYKCVERCKDKDGTWYNKEEKDGEGNIITNASTISADDLAALFKGVYVTSSGDFVLEANGNTPMLNSDGTPYNSNYWVENGVRSRYAGRLMNTIQRADFCGVFGSRMVMKGAQDRVPETVDYTNYTINRVREVSLNKNRSVIDGDLTLKTGATPAPRIEDQNPDDYQYLDKAIHGNYFGIYNIVNFLGALSSDVHFREGDDIRRTDNPTTDNTSAIAIGSNTYQYGSTGATYYNWKKANINNRKRNNGSSFNQVALASGVYLELTTERSTGTGLREKDWGPVTGVIELDLINVQTGVGGGFVYAKNEHGKCTYNPKKHATLTALNADAITRKDYTYSTTEADLEEWETSGNFVHSTQTIIDDCYNISGKYKGSDAMPAHFWYIKGQVYVYDQEISAYTGAPNAYSETVDIPLTITAASHGKMTLLDVKPNRYAYYSSSGAALENNQKLVIGDVEYYKNDPISYWDWNLLSTAEKGLFVEETYVTIADCKIGETTYPAGTVLLPGNKDGSESGTYYALKKNNPTVYHVEKQQDVDFDFVFRSSNNLSHDTGYILTYKVNNPTEWNTWYTEQSDNANNANTAREKNQTGGDGFEDGPTYHLISGSGSLLGQQDYKKGDLISQDIETTYQAIVTNHPSAIPSDPAEFEAAYLVTEEATLGDTHLNPGSAVSETDAASLSGKVSPAFICTSTIQLSKTEFIYLNARMTETEKTGYVNRVTAEITAILPEAAAANIKKLGDLTNEQLSSLTDEQRKQLSSLLTTRNDINDNIVPAYYCTTAGPYGGDYYEPNKNYRGLAAWCSMSNTDRQKFAFNYDALDLLIEPTYKLGEEGKKYQYDGKNTNGDAFSTEEQARTNAAGYSLTQALDYSATYTGTEALSYTDKSGASHSVAVNAELSRADYEAIPNEKRHYAPIQVNATGHYYVVKKSFIVGNTPYAVGSIVSQDIYNNSNYTSFIADLDVKAVPEGNILYFCRESYEVNEHGEGVTVSAASTDIVTSGVSGTYSSGNEVPVGLVIAKTSYESLKNKQSNFTIHGISPTETSSLYVSRNSDIFDLSTEKIITVIYQYDYEESGTSGGITPISERHVVNIHIKFKSGVPTVEDIKAPQIVLPGTYISLREPNVIPGAYEVTGGGWEIFEKIGDAESHTNGIEYTPSDDPMYWYQNGYYLTYYAKTYLGKTYSNHVPISVANYHDLKDVLEKENHYHIDKPVSRNCKVYINNYDGDKDGIDLLRDLMDLTYDKEAAKAAYGAFETPANIQGAQDLDIIMRTNISHTGSWTPIAQENGECFSGTLHGDGYYIEGLDKSLFGHLCGNVYNLGVTGSFTSAGVADASGVATTDEEAEKRSGYVENCWVKTTGSPSGVKAVFSGGKDGTQKSAKYARNLVVNCYYSTSNTYTVGLATGMDLDDFHNGTVAYNLNGFYLNKRYYDKTQTSGTKYNYLENDPTTGTLKENMSEAYYPADYALYPLKEEGGKYGYVEDRYSDGDFIYAGGTIPETTEERMRTVIVGTTPTTVYVPIWPDDYLYFGQMLTYGWNELRPHEEMPSHLYKSGGRLVATDMSNRVYRAPAYYGDATRSVAHFNPNFNLVAYAKPANAADTNPHPAYPGLTAIDFAGYHKSGENYEPETGYSLGWSADKKYFYQPLLDDGGLQSIVNRDETTNLLVYVPTAEQNQKTFNVLTNYFKEPAFSDYYNTEDKYRRVAVAPTSSIFGHLVQNGLTTTSDHLLVDKQDFNCPIPYSMGTGYRMWYQRTPDNFVTMESGKTKGWEGICLPFEAELVSTQDKGEITHFNERSLTGHEYWLRVFNGGSVNSENTSEFVGIFNALPAGTHSKVFKNTYLYDTYYSKDEFKDKNEDVYKQIYYKGGENGVVNKYEDYPYNAVGTPYLVGFPGATYYEFDLSGEWEPANRLGVTAINYPGRQVISFVSESGGHIGVSDSELKNTTVEGCDYAYVPNYINKTWDEKDKAYLLAEDGASYVKNAAGATVSAFRPYIMKVGTSGTRGTESNEVNRVVFGSDNSDFIELHGDPSNGLNDGTLIIAAKRKKICVESQLGYTTDVRIVTPAGVTLAAYTIQPTEYVETHVSQGGVYIVYADDGKYVNKVIVR